MLRSNVSAMLVGTLVAQGLPIALTPVLSRIYSPDAFGLQALVMGITAALVVVSTLRLDLALVIAAEDAEARALLWVMGLMTFAISATAAIAIFVIGDSAIEITGFSGALNALLVVPPLVAATAAFQIRVGLWSRAGNFRPVALANVINQIGYAVTGLGTGLLSALSFGLALAKLCGQSLALLAVSVAWRRESHKTRVGRSEKVPLSQLWGRYWQFVTFNTPYSLIGTLSREAPIFILTGFAALPAAGFFGLARMITGAPALLATNAFSPIFYRYAAASHGTPDFFATTHKLLTTSFLMLAAPFALCAVWGDSIFVLVFGSTWRDAGELAMLIAPAAWLSAQTGWPERLAEASGRQGATFAVQIVCDTATIVAMVWIYATTGSAWMLVACYAVCNCIYHILYLSTLYTIAGFALGAAVKLFLGALVGFAVIVMVLGTGRHYIGDGILSLGLAFGFVAILTAAIALVLRRTLWTGNWRMT